MTDRTTFAVRSHKSIFLVPDVVIAVSVWLSKRFGQRMDQSPFLQRIARYIEGNYIDTALASMTAISAFESEAKG